MVNSSCARLPMLHGSSFGSILLSDGAKGKIKFTAGLKLSSDSEEQVDEDLQLLAGVA